MLEALDVAAPVRSQPPTSPAAVADVKRKDPSVHATPDHHQAHDSDESELTDLDAVESSSDLSSLEESSDGDNESSASEYARPHKRVKRQHRMYNAATMVKWTKLDEETPDHAQSWTREDRKAVTANRMQLCSGEFWDIRVGDSVLDSMSHSSASVFVLTADHRSRLRAWRDHAGTRECSW